MNNLLFESAINEYLNYIRVKKKLNTYLTNERRIKKYILTYSINTYSALCARYCPIYWEYARLERVPDPRTLYLSREL